MTICRSLGSRTTADSCREDTVTTLLVAILQVHKMRKQNVHRHQLYIKRHAKHIIYIYIHYKATHIYSIDLHHKHLCSHGGYIYTYLCLSIYIYNNINSLGNKIINMSHETCTAHTEHNCILSLLSSCV